MSFRIRQAYTTLLVQSCLTLRAPIGSSVRQYATNNNEQKEVAILGGGITGLAAAFALIQLSKNHRVPPNITIYESKPTLGGWVSSEFVDVPGGKVLLEKAVRTLRPAGASGLVGLWTIHKLGLEEELLTCSRDSPAAKNRYVYYPDHLVRMPSSIRDIPGFLREPLAKGLVQGLFKDLVTTEDFSKTPTHFRESSDPNMDTSTNRSFDVSVEGILARRFHPGVANIASAVFHGIYAGDVGNLSLSMLLPQLRNYLQEHRSITRGALHSLWASVARDEVSMSHDDAVWYSIISIWWAQEAEHRSKTPNMDVRLAALQRAQRSSVFSFKQGIQQLSDKLAEFLRRSSRVTIKTNTNVASIRVDTHRASPKVNIKTTKGPGRQFTHAITTIPSPILNTLLGLDEANKDLNRRERVIKTALTLNHHVSVMVVNLWFSRTDLLPVQGFGYLIPKDMKFEQNPELGLGVVFDSDAIQGQDTVPGTKLTVMLGGHRWNGFMKHQLPSESEGIAQARSLIARHLGITDEPVIARATMQWHCIPQYQQFHPGNMIDLQREFKGDGFRGRLIPAGSSYEGVGVNDCIRSGWSAAMALLRNYADPGLHKVVTSAQPFARAAKSHRQFKFE